jgi:hypothetical protein
MQANSPVDVELDIENSAFSPGVRRLLATAGQQAPFDQGRQQMKLLVGLEVTTQAVERIAEAIGQDIAACEQKEIERALPLDLPILVGEPVAILYALLEGTGVPVVRKETEGRSGKNEGAPAHTREVQLGCVLTQAPTDAQGYSIRAVRQTPLSGSLETGREPRRKEGGHG